MLDIELINDTIRELEQEPTSYENCNTLASLYICREMNKNANMSLLEGSESVSHNNIQILPSYNKYVDTKRRYQQFEVVDKMLIYAMDDVCKDIVEFVANLYRNTETEGERALLVEMINNLRSAI